MKNRTLLGQILTVVIYLYNTAAVGLVVVMIAGLIGSNSIADKYGDTVPSLTGVNPLGAILSFLFVGVVWFVFFFILKKVRDAAGFITDSNKSEVSSKIKLKRKINVNSKKIYLSISALLVITVSILILNKYVYNGFLFDFDDDISIVENITLPKFHYDNINRDIEGGIYVYRDNNQERIDGILYNKWGNITKINNGLVNGKIREWNKNGTIDHIGHYKNGIEDGIFKYWYDSGKISAINYYKNGLSDGVHKSWWENGKVSVLEDYYENGKLNGIFKEWNEDGKLIKEGDFIKGLKNGWHLEYYDNGNRKKFNNYRNGEKNGYEIKYYKNGDQESRINYTNGKMDGESFVWGLKRNKKEWGKYDLGKPLWYISYYENENIRWEKIYKNGIEKNWTWWNCDGSVSLKQGSYTNTRLVELGPSKNCSIHTTDFCKTKSWRD